MRRNLAVTPYTGWLIWNLADGVWRANPEQDSAPFTHDIGDARYFLNVSEVDLGPDDMVIPYGVYINLVEHTRAKTRTVLTPVQQLLGELSATVLDRHSTVSQCGWDHPCEGRTVGDVVTDLLRHIAEDHR